MAQLVSEFCRLDLTCPVPGCGPHEVRTLLLEGMLRLRENSAKVREIRRFTSPGLFPSPPRLRRDGINFGFGSRLASFTH